MFMGTLLLATTGMAKTFIEASVQSGRVKSPVALLMLAVDVLLKKKMEGLMMILILHQY